MSSAFILGYTGATGKELVKCLAKDNPFKSVVLIGRREARLPVENDGRFEQKLVDFEKIEEHEEAFRGCDVGFCCLGTTRGKSGKEGFVRIDRDYVVNSARVAKSAGCKHFQVVTASTSAENSFFLYNKTKGQVESMLKDLSFQRLSVFRPAFILADREESRPLEKCLKVLFTPLVKLAPREGSVPVEYIAQAMVTNAGKEATGTVDIISNQEIHLLAGH